MFYRLVASLVYRNVVDSMGISKRDQANYNNLHINMVTVFEQPG